MIRAGILLFAWAVVIWFSSFYLRPAPASEITDRCAEIRQSIAAARKAGMKMADIETFARTNGATDEQIAEGRKCFRHRPVNH